MEKKRYVIDDLVLTLEESSHLVLIDECDSDRTLHGVEDLPGWVFESPYAIWLTAGDEPIRVRALEGERVRQKLSETALRQSAFVEQHLMKPHRNQS